jgi:hypothetical protein
MFDIRELDLNAQAESFAVDIRELDLNAQAESFAEGTAIDEAITIRPQSIRVVGS